MKCRNKLTISQGIWRTMEDASNGSKGQAHLRAVRATRNLYSEWNIEQLRLRVGRGALDWEIVNWKDPFDC